MQQRKIERNNKYPQVHSFTKNKLQSDFRQLLKNKIRQILFWAYSLKMAGSTYIQELDGVTLLTYRRGDTTVKEQMLTDLSTQTTFQSPTTVNLFSQMHLSLHRQLQAEMLYFHSHATGPPHKTQQKLEVIAEKSPDTETTFTRLLRHSIFSAFLAL